MDALGVFRAEVVEDRSANGVGARLTVTAVGEVDMATAPTLEAALEEALTEGAIVTVDMAGVRFMGSDGIRVLVWARKRLRSVDGDLFLRAVAPGIQRALAICGLEDLIGDDRGQPRVEFVGDALTRRTPGDGSADLLA